VCGMSIRFRRSAGCRTKNHHGSRKGESNDRGSAIQVVSLTSHKLQVNQNDKKPSVQEGNSNCYNAVIHSTLSFYTNLALGAPGLAAAASFFAS